METGAKAAGRAKRPIGRPGRYAKFEEFERSLPKLMEKRPAYCDSIGIFNGATGSTVFVKIRFPRGGMYRGSSIPKGGTREIKLGKRVSWDWQGLIDERDRLQGRADRGEPLEAEEIPTFEQYGSDWLERKKATLRSYGVTEGNYRVLKKAFGKKTLDAITVGDVNRWIAKQSAKLKPSSVKRQLNTFDAIMNDAVRNAVIVRNPSDGADKITGIEARLRFITEDEWQVVLATAEKIEAEREGRKKSVPHQKRGWLKHFLVWAYNSGMRRAEILDLRWGDVQKIDEATTTVRVDNTKTSRPRSVTCTTEMLAVLDDLKTLERVGGDDRLFPLSMTTLKRSLTKLWKETGLKDVRLHDLRRTHATLLINSNVSPRVVAGRLGHSGTSMLAKHYAVDLGDVDAARIFSESLTKGK